MQTTKEFSVWFVVRPGKKPVASEDVKQFFEEQWGGVTEYTLNRDPRNAVLSVRKTVPTVQEAIRLLAKATKRHHEEYWCKLADMTAGGVDVKEDGEWVTWYCEPSGADVDEHMGSDGEAPEDYDPDHCDCLLTDAQRAEWGRVRLLPRSA